MQLIGKILNTYNRYAHKWLEIPRKSKMDAISAWQAIFFKKVLMLLLPFSVVLYVPGFFMSLKEGLYILAALDTIALCVLLFAFFAGNLKLQTRKIIVLTDFYLLGLFLLVYLGWSGPGLIYLLSVSVLSSLILGKPAGYITLACNFVVFILFVLFVNKWIFFESNLDSGGIFAVGLNFILFNGLLVLAVSSLTEALHKALVKEQQTKKRLEKEVVQHKIAREKAVESDKLKSMFLANVSHEIRTPMNGILGFADLLKNPQLSGEQQKKFIAIIQKSGERMLATITDLINISIIESGQEELHILPANLKKMLEELSEFYRNQAEEKKLVFRSHCEVSDAELQVTTDEHKLYAVLSNLLKNAVKYTSNGSIELNCSRYPDCLFFEVKDTGTGIPKDKQDVVFDRFTQAHVYEKGEFEGSGLGLSIAKAYTELLGGKISFVSEPGSGTTFRVQIPAVSGDKELENKCS